MYTSNMYKLNTYDVPAYRVVAQKFPHPFGWVYLGNQDKPYMHLKSRYRTNRMPKYLILDDMVSKMSFFLDSWVEKTERDGKPYYERNGAKMNDFPIPKSMEEDPTELPYGWTRVTINGETSYVYRTGYVTKEKPKFGRYQ